MSTEIKVPVLPESVADASVATWHVSVGDKVSRDQNLVDIETDKVVLEVVTHGFSRHWVTKTAHTATTTSGKIL